MRADEILESLVVCIETAIAKCVIEDRLGLLLVGPGDTNDVQDRHVLGVS